MIKILHLYHDLMNLYGDWANADILARAIEARGFEVAIDKKSVGEHIDFGSFNFIYIGSGTERSQRACMSDLMRHKEALAEVIEAGRYVLATGNSHELFGLGVTAADGEHYKALGLLNFDTIQEKSRVTGDAVYEVSFLSGKLIGFVNRAGGRQGGTESIDRPLTAVMSPESGLGERREGIRYKNLFGLYLTGPVLVRNPSLLKYYADALTDDAEMKDGGKNMLLFTQQWETYQKALDELVSIS